MKSGGNKIEKKIIEKAKELGASLAGIATVDDLKASKSYEIYDKSPFYEEYKGVKWREEHKSILVWALVHPASARTRLVEHEGPGLYPRQPCDAEAVETAADLAG